MNKILSLAVFGLAGFACAANCLDVLYQIHLAESELFIMGGDVLDSLHMQNGSGSFANRIFQWDGNYISSIATTRSGVEGDTISTTTNIQFVSDEGDVSPSGISILSLKEEKDDQIIFHNTRYELGKVDGEILVTVDEKSLTLEYTSRSDASTMYDKLEYTRSNDTLYSRGWRNGGSEENKLAMNRYTVADKDFKNCSEWKASASGENPKQEFTLEIIDTESGYVLRKTEYGVEDSQYLQEYFFTELKDNGSVETPDTSAVEPPKDTSVVDTTVTPQDSAHAPKDTMQAIAKQMKAVPVLKPRDHYIDLKGRSFSKQKKQLPYRVLF